MARLVLVSLCMRVTFVSSIGWILVIIMTPVHEWGASVSGPHVPSTEYCAPISCLKFLKRASVGILVSVSTRQSNAVRLNKSRICWAFESQTIPCVATVNPDGLRVARENPWLFLNIGISRGGIDGEC